MELRHPLLIVILSIAFIIFIIFYKRKNNKFSVGSKIANTSFIKNTDYFKKKLKIYKLVKLLVNCLCILCVFINIFMLGRLSLVETHEEKEYNRDIMLCMDVSGSVFELNKDITKSLKETVKSLDGDRVGITIFNSSAVTLAPLTDDYDYILDVLNKIERSIDAYGSNSDKYEPGEWRYIYTGTNEGDRGSSLIGEGLATCVYGFSNLDEERSRAIIFTTDNDLAGNPILTTAEAATIAKNKNIKIFSIGTSNVYGENENVLKQSASKTGGKYYKHNQTTAKKIVNDIDQLSKSELDGQLQVTQTDLPTIPFILLVMSSICLIVINRKVVK